MANLIKAELVRLFKNKLFWFVLAALTGVSVYYLCGSAEIFTKASTQGFSYSMHLFEAQPSAVFVISIFITFFTGTLFSQKVIKNLLTAGYSKVKIFLCEAIVTSVSSVIFALVSCINGLYIIFFKGYSAEIYLTFTVIIIIVFLSINLLAVTISFIFSNKAVSVVVVCAVLLLMFLSYSKISPMLSGSPYYTEIDTINGIPYEEGQVITEEDYENGDITYKQVENPYYLSGTKRKIYEFIYDFLPTTQTAVLSEVYISTEQPGFAYATRGLDEPQPDRVSNIIKPKTIIYSLMWMGLLSALGVVIFKKKQLS